MSSSNDEHEKDSQEANISLSKSFGHLPVRTMAHYAMAHDNFMKWKESRNVPELSEDAFIMYFQEMAEKYKPSSLWSLYSKIKYILISRNVLDISKFTKLRSFLREKASGYTGVQSKVLTEEQIRKFLNEAPDEIYLATKVAFIFGVAGACTIQHLRHLTSKDVKDYGELMHVKLSSFPESSRTPARSFVVDGFYYDIAKKYHVCRLKKTNNGDYYFQTYKDGKCRSQPIGKNKFGRMPKQIAKYLKLPNPEAYSGFKRTSAALQDAITPVSIKKHHQRYSRRAKYSDEPLNDDALLEVIRNTETNQDPLHSIKIEISGDEHDPENNLESALSPSTSLDEPLSVHRSRYSQKPPTSFEYEVTAESNDISPALNSVSEVPSKKITFNFYNCTFNNSFNH